MGDSRLLEMSALVGEYDTPALHQLVQDLFDTMGHLDGAGLAAPQIGVLQQVVIFQVEENPRYPDVEPVPQTVLVNPRISVIGTQTAGMWEGCLSVPGMRGYVERPDEIRYSGFDQYGNSIDRHVTGFHATVVQHECDHLDGILYPMRMNDMSLFGFEEVLSTPEE
jgi:peptide deformylase